jgi:polyhydroxyalkanoate synthesis regulator phasin
MNNNKILEIAQQSFRVTVGAATSLVETVQNPQKRNAALSELNMELNKRTQEWASKGEATEQELKKKIEELLNRVGAKSTQNKDNNSNNFNSKSAASEIYELTQKIRTLRTELEQLRQNNKSK